VFEGEVSGNFFACWNFDRVVAKFDNEVSFCGILQEEAKVGL
jgi:hypothetical protein